MDTKERKKLITDAAAEFEAGLLKNNAIRGYPRPTKTHYQRHRSTLGGNPGSCRGKYLFQGDPKQYTPWAEELIALLRNSQGEEVLRRLERIRGKAFPGAW
ncbi:MAG: hypothetical protein LBK43_05950 [Treponema sp.]|jgi:hypothetical protein|nr:hypothetical protein [Treponema sp.]